MSYLINQLIICLCILLSRRGESLRILPSLTLGLDNTSIRHNIPKYGFISNANRTHISQTPSRTFRRYNVAPRGSRIEFEINQFKIDPINKSPWEYETPFLDSKFSKEQNYSYKTLKNEWGYLDHSEDLNQPAGVIEGGPQNYEGKGLKLVGGKDRQRTEYIPYYLDHGVQFRQRVRAGSISFDIAPIASQEVAMYETDIDLENRQWGSWHQPYATGMGMLRSLLPSRIRIENPTELPYPWITRFDVFERLPLHRERPSTIIPPIEPDLRLAALNRFGGIVPGNPDHLSTEESLVRQKKLLAEWTRLEKLYKKTKNPRLLEEIKLVKFTLFGIPDFSDSDDEMLKVVSEAALIRARMMLEMQVMDWRSDPETIEYYLTKIYDDEIDPDSKYEGPEKTVALNLINYRPISTKFRMHTTIEEMAECYHRLITENRREGRTHTRTNMVAEEEYKHYPLRKYRKNFPALEAEYKPIWTNRSYGSEFGDALRKSQKIPEDVLTEFGRPLKKRKRRLTKEERKSNFRDDYSSFKREYDY